MVRRSPQVTALLVLVACASLSWAEEPASQPALTDPKTIIERVRLDRAELAKAQRQVIEDTMALTADEAKLFWPIHESCQREIQAAGDEGIEVVKRCLEAHADGKLDQASAKSLLDAYFNFETRRTEILKRHCDQIGEKLSLVRAAQYAQVQHRIRVAVDLHLAAAMPLLNAAPKSDK